MLKNPKNINSTDTTQVGRGQTFSVPLFLSICVPILVWACQKWEQIVPKWFKINKNSLKPNRNTTQQEQKNIFLIQKVQLESGGSCTDQHSRANVERRRPLGWQYLFKHAAKYGDDVLDEELWVQGGGQVLNHGVNQIQQRQFLCSCHLQAKSRTRYAIQGQPSLGPGGEQPNACQPEL